MRAQDSKDNRKSELQCILNAWYVNGNLWSWQAHDDVIIMTSKPITDF